MATNIPDDFSYTHADCGTVTEVGRNIVVKRAALSQESEVVAGVFVGRRLVRVVDSSLDASAPTGELLQALIKEGLEIDMPSGDMGPPGSREQLGIRRTWSVRDLGEGDVVRNCHIAWARTGRFVGAGHEFTGSKFPAIPETTEEGHRTSDIDVFLVSDLSSLPPPAPT